MSDKTVPAWLIEVAPGVEAVLPQQSMGHLIDQFNLHRIPQAPPYASHLCVWRGQLTSVLNLSALLTEYAQLATLLAIVAYREGDEVRHGALALCSPPKLIDVPSELADWPQERTDIWQQLGDCCVTLAQGERVILNPDRMFAYRPA